MTREDKDSLVEMLSKIPVTETKGSLLSAIGKLLRVLDISESSIMIPTLLKDKCEFDAYEMLTLAKVLKASILGHNDLVEFYMTESSSPSLSLMSTSSSSSSSSSSPPSSTSAKLQRHQSSNITSSMMNNNIHNNNHTSSNSNNFRPASRYNPQQSSATPSIKYSSSSERTTSTASLSSSSTHILPMHMNAVESSSIGSISSGYSNERDIHGSKQTTARAQLGPNGDPDSTVRLLLQIEQLKTFIPQVTGIFESIIELYKNSVDCTYGRIN